MHESAARWRIHGIDDAKRRLEVEKYRKEVQWFLQAVDDGAFCDTTFTPPAFESELIMMMQKLEASYGRYVPLMKLDHFPDWEEDRPYWIKVVINYSGIFFSKTVKGNLLWQGFSVKRVARCEELADKKRRMESSKISSI